jgi:hypothetical protein
VMLENGGEARFGRDERNSVYASSRSFSGVAGRVPATICKLGVSNARLEVTPFVTA